MQHAPSTHCRHWPYWLVIILLTLACAVSSSLLLASRPASSIVSAEGEGVDEFPVFSETHSWGAGATKVARISFSGIMTDAVETGFFAAANPLHGAIRRIRAAAADKDVKAILLEMDSPGGELTAADELHHELAKFRESDPKRRVVVFVRGMAASGGYYASLPADRIVAAPTSILGSIGVILQSWNAKPLADKIGVSDVTIKSGRHKDMLNPLREEDPEERALLQAQIDRMLSRFVKLVAGSRGLPEEKVRELADGRIFDAEEALAAKLVDGIGYFEDAVGAVETLLGADDVFLVTYETTTGWGDLLSAPFSSAAAQTLRSLSAAAVPRFVARAPFAP